MHIEPAPAPAPEAIGIRVTYMPTNLSAKDSRSYRRMLQKHRKTIGIKGMMMSAFEVKSVADQFLFLRQYIPDKHEPTDISPWYGEGL